MKLPRLLERKLLDSNGISHIVVPILMVLIVSIAGVATLLASHADSNGCGRGQIKVEALPTDFVSGPLKGRAMQGHGLVCVKKGTQGSRVITNVPRPTYTIIKSYNCGRSIVAYDGHNPDGTGFHKHWFVQTDNGDGNSTGKRTLYCISTSMLNKDMNWKGREKGWPHAGIACDDDPFESKCHVYRFVPLYTLGQGCSKDIDYDRWLHTACTSTRYFTTYQDDGRDFANPQ